MDVMRPTDGAKCTYINQCLKSLEPPSLIHGQKLHSGSIAFKCDTANYASAVTQHNSLVTSSAQRATARPLTIRCLRAVSYTHLTLPTITKV